MKRINPFENEGKRPCPPKPDESPCLPPELIQSVISFLDFPARRSALAVSKSWNYAVYEQEKLVKLADYQLFLEVVLGHLDLKYISEREIFINLLVESRTFVLTVPVFPIGYLNIRKTSDEIEGKINKRIPDLEEVLMCLEAEDLDAVFDAFQGNVKPDVFYELVTMSGKYLKFECQMLNHLQQKEEAQVFALLNQGAVPTSMVLCQAIYFGASLELLTTLLRVSPQLLDAVLNYTIGENAPLDLLSTVVNAGAVPNESTLTHAIKKKCSHEKIVFLLNSGVIPTINALRLTLSENLSEKTTLAVLNAGAIPSSDVVNLAIFSQSSAELITRMVAVMVREGAVLNSTLLVSALLLNNHEVIIALLNAGVVVTEDIRKQAMRSYIPPETLTAIKEAYLRNNSEEK